MVAKNKSKKPAKSVKKSKKISKKEAIKKEKKFSIKKWFVSKKEKKAEKYHPKKWHKSFKRSYREDYKRELNTPGLVAHTANTFKLIFSNWKIFLPFLIIIIIMNLLLVGLLSQSTYDSFKKAIDETNEELSTGHLGNVGKAALTVIGTVSTGGLNSEMSDVQKTFVAILAVIIWLVTIYLVRHLIAGNKPKLRDGLYNALTPLISSLCVIGVMLIEAIPIMIVIVTYSAAVSTDFLSTPFYALVYFIAAALLCLLSGYLLSGSFIALIAITAPGLYPMTAINTATDLIAGRRVRLVIRILFAFVVIAIYWVIIMLPVILLDNWFKSWVEWLTDVPVVPFVLSLLTTFSFIFFSAYSYLYYRQLLDYNSEN